MQVVYFCTCFHEWDWTVVFFLSSICHGYSCIIKSFREFLCSLKHFIWQCLSLEFVHFIYVIVFAWLSSGDNSLIIFYCFCGCSSIQFYFSFLIVLFFFSVWRVIYVLECLKFIRIKREIVFSYNFWPLYIELFYLFIFSRLELGIKQFFKFSKCCP